MSLIFDQSHRMKVIKIKITKWHRRKCNTSIFCRSHRQKWHFFNVFIPWVPLLTYYHQYFTYTTKSWNPSEDLYLFYYNDIQVKKILCHLNMNNTSFFLAKSTTHRPIRYRDMSTFRLQSNSIKLNTKVIWNCWKWYLQFQKVIVL